MRKLAIVGSHPTTRELAPFDDESFEIWVFNEAAQAPWCKRWDVCFQLHKPEVYMSPNNYSNQKHWEWLQENHGRKVIYMQDYDELVPNSRGYPIEAIKETLPGAVIHLDTGDTTWMTSTPSMALAMALYLGYNEIHIWGVELTSNTEYFRQLPNWVYWVGVAYGRGVNVVIHSGHEHYQDVLYGWNGEVQLKKEYFTNRLAELEGNFSDAEKELHKLKGRINDAMLDFKPDQVAKYVMQMREVAIQAGTISGAIAEAKRCAERFDPIPRQEIEKRAAQAQIDGEGLKSKMYHVSGKLEYVWNVWRNTQDLNALNQLRKLTGEATQLAYDVGAHSGIYKENLVYMQDLDRLIDAAGGVKTLQSLGVA